MKGDFGKLRYPTIPWEMLPASTDSGNCCLEEKATESELRYPRLLCSSAVTAQNPYTYTHMHTYAHIYIGLLSIDIHIYMYSFTYAPLLK